MSPERTASPTFEVYPKHEILIKKPLDRPPENLSTGLPRVAIIIDDMGYDRAMAEKFLSLEVPLTFSLFPHGPHREYIVRRAHERGLDVMLHLPMEPVEYPSVNPGPGALLTGMSPDQLILQLKRNLDTIPTLVGVNNHMGSRMTTVSTQMYQIFTILKQRELFFIDSLTTAQSVCKPSARLLQVPFAQRDVFLDHRPESEFVRGQIRLLTRIARSHGEAIGIGHPHEVTYRILRDILPRLQREVHLVPAADLVRPTG